MKVKPCQLNYENPCVNRGDLCLCTPEEKVAYNMIISEIQKKLEELKFKGYEED